MKFLRASREIGRPRRRGGTRKSAFGAGGSGGAYRGNRRGDQGFRRARMFRSSIRAIAAFALLELCLVMPQPASPQEVFHRASETPACARLCRSEEAGPGSPRKPDLHPEKPPCASPTTKSPRRSGLRGGLFAQGSKRGRVLGLAREDKGPEHHRWNRLASRLSYCRDRAVRVGPGSRSSCHGERTSSDAVAVRRAIDRGEEFLFRELPLVRRDDPMLIYNIWAHAYGIRKGSRYCMHGRLPNDAARRSRIGRSASSAASTTDSPAMKPRRGAGATTISVPAPSGPTAIRAASSMRPSWSPFTRQSRSACRPRKN